METVSNDAAALKERAIQSREGADEAIQSITDVENKLPEAEGDARILLKNMAEGKRAITLAYESGETLLSLIKSLHKDARKYLRM